MMKNTQYGGALKFIVPGFALLLAAGCAGQMEYARVMDEVRQAQEQAASVGGEWRDVPLFIKQAKAAAADAEFEKALELARKAKLHSELGYRQAVSQQGEIQLPSYLKPQQ